MAIRPLKRLASTSGRGAASGRYALGSQGRQLEVAIASLVGRGRHSQGNRSKQSQSSKKWLERQEKDPYLTLARKLNFPSRSLFKLQEINEEIFPALLKKQKNRRGNKGDKRKQKQLIRPDMLVLDLGAAPGGWSLYASTRLHSSLGGAIVAIDLLPLDETLRHNHTDISSRIRSNLQGNFEFIQGDFTDSGTHLRIMESFDLMGIGNNVTSPEDEEFNEDSRRPHLILSDMAPNFTGDSQTDAIRTLNLCEQALALAAGKKIFDPSRSEEDGRGLLADGGAFLCKYFSCGREDEGDLMDASERAFGAVHRIKPKASRKESGEMYLLGLDFNCR